jgi:hypothetical protein
MGSNLPSFRDSPLIAARMNIPKIVKAAQGKIG